MKCSSDHGNIHDWPAMMRKGTAAAYLDLSVAVFSREVVAGVIPPPIVLGGRPSWSRRQIDAAMERLTEEQGADDWRSRTNLYNPDGA